MAVFDDLTASEGLEAALEAAEHLTAADAGAVAVSRKMARLIDTDEATSYDVQVYLQSLKALTLDASSRLAASLTQTDTKSKVADMRAERERRGRKSA